MIATDIYTQTPEQTVQRENDWLLLIAVMAMSLLIAFAGQYLLISDNLYFNAFAEQMTFEQIKETIDQSHRWSWLVYVILPVFSLLKFMLVAACLSLGYYFITSRWVFRVFFGWRCRRSWFC